MYFFTSIFLKTFCFVYLGISKTSKNIKNNKKMTKKQKTILSILFACQWVSALLIPLIFILKFEIKMIGYAVLFAVFSHVFYRLREYYEIQFKIRNINEKYALLNRRNKRAFNRAALKKFKQ